LLPPKTLRPVPDMASDTLEEWHLEPTHPDWAGGLRESWQPGEISALARLNAFSEGGVAGYAGDRDRPDRRGTSGLSLHLRFGEISPRQVWHAARFAAAERPALAGDVDKYLSELGWREFCRHLVFDAPDLALRFRGNLTTRHLSRGNPANWQWVAGADAALPELAQLPTGLIHQPWRAAPLELKGAGVELGTTYPGPIIDHRAGRERALKAYAKVRAM
jgi:deoxyribodipyrimidine photolyase